MKYVMQIPIGDWTGDGHGKCKEFYILSTHKVELLRQAYKDSCKLMGIQFNNIENYTGLDECNKSSTTDRIICVECEDNTLSDTVVEILKEFDCPYTGMLKSCYISDVKELVDLILWFIGKSMPTDWQWEEIEIDSLNGYYNAELNVQFGYGMFL